jgi:hypothetical protein
VLFFSARQISPCLTVDYHPPPTWEKAILAAETRPKYPTWVLAGYEFKLKTMAVQILVHQINAHRLRSVFTSVNAALPMSGNYIYLIQEPYLYQGNVCSLDKARLFYSRNLHCRTVIFSNLPLTFHASLSVRDCTTCSVPMNGKNTYFSSVYLDINRTIEEPFWTKTIQKAQTTGSHHYAGIDSNAHSPMWGSPTPNPRGCLWKTLSMHIAFSS